MKILKNKILVTGGLGYIGSHISQILGENCVIIDDGSNSKLNYKKYLPKCVVFKNKVNEKNLSKIFKKYKIQAIVHLASFKSVNDSVKRPLKYYDNNFFSTLSLLKSMNDFNIKKIIFSSSCTIYGQGDKYPINENFPYKPINPYGNTKMFSEILIEDYANIKKDFHAISLRYFNPVGANFLKGLSESPLGKPLNIMPSIMDAVYKKKPLTVYGDDYQTYDGTCIRDYVHVSDVAEAHIKALNKITKAKGHEKINIGLGKGISVLKLIKIFEKANKVKVPYVIGKRRDGDIAKAYADNKKALKFLSWRPRRTYDQMCRDAWQSYLANS